MVINLLYMRMLHYSCVSILQFQKGKKNHATAIIFLLLTCYCAMADGCKWGSL